MAKYTMEQIVDQARELAKMIAQTEEVEMFKQAEAKLNENKKVYMLIEEIKHYQKEAVNLAHYGKEEALKQTEEKINQLLEKVNAFPIVQQFQESQEDVNNLLQLVATTISNKVTDEIILSTGGDVLKGTTGSQQKNNTCGC
ncbi:YlbF/YmcA family competence regulator [Massilibacterium senegalense]|uniref:RicAFT regulatory complex protein RicA family protein n=1 Tax=Massilibacterium senegalense TaxID=1632858 RepID=UPI000780EF2F|nr:RicAFT regulatory complex protein RicA family protein [Massilibacterium senegalense]